MARSKIKFLKYFNSTLSIIVKIHCCIVHSLFQFIFPTMIIFGTSSQNNRVHFGLGFYRVNIFVSLLDLRGSYKLVLLI